MKLTTSAGGVETDRNVYWLSTSPDTLDWGGSTWYYTPVSSYADLTSLTGLAPATVSAVASTQRTGENATTTVTLRNTGTGRAPAFFVDAVAAACRTASRVLPATWSDNYVTLWPGESVTLSTTYRVADAGTGPLSMDLSGVNVALTSRGSTVPGRCGPTEQPTGRQDRRAGGVAGRWRQRAAVLTTTPARWPQGRFPPVVMRRSFRWFWRLWPIRRASCRSSPTRLSSRRRPSRAPPCSGR